MNWKNRSILSLALLLAGCIPPQPKAPVAYLGPTDPMTNVVLDINRNNQKVPSLWSQLDYRATLVEKDGKETVVSGDGGLLYARPGSLRLVGNKDIAGKVFELGSNDDVFWMTVAGSTDTTWWGKYKNLGKPGAKEIPIRPDLIVEVLGVSLFNTNFLQQPVPVMRFNNEADCYMFTWNAQDMDRWVALKEVWYDRVTKNPKLILLFDENGRVILRAALGAPIHVEVPGQDEKDWPVVASQYSLFFPDSKTKMAFELRNVTTQHKKSPSPRSFAKPEDFESKNVIQIDADVHD